MLTKFHQRDHVHENWQAHQDMQHPSNSEDQALMSLHPVRPCRNCMYNTNHTGND